MSTLPAEVAAKIGDLLDTAPVDVAEVARRLGLAIYRKALAPGVSGALVKAPELGSPSGFVVYVDSGEPYARQRFTAAHEIGHFVLHRDKIGDRIEDNHLLRSDRLSDRVEVEANRFAAHLLMPFPLLDRLIREGVRTVPDLARALQVSEIAMGIRLGHPT